MSMVMYVQHHGEHHDSAVVTATRGVRQGLSSSCFSFIIFVNELIKRVKNACQPEPFLQWLHIVM